MSKKALEIDRDKLAALQVAAIRLNELFKALNMEEGEPGRQFAIKNALKWARDSVVQLRLRCPLLLGEDPTK